MNADLRLSEISSGRLVLERPETGHRIVLNFVTPCNWSVGDTVAMQINRLLRYLRVRNGTYVIELAEPANGWEREFYTLYNGRTKDRVTVDFDSVEGFEELADDARKIPSAGK